MYVKARALPFWRGFTLPKLKQTTQQSTQPEKQMPINNMIKEIRQKESSFQKLKQIHDGELVVMISDVKILIAEKVQDLTSWRDDPDVTVRVRCEKGGPLYEPAFYVKVTHLNGQTYDLIRDPEFAVYSIETQTSGRIDDTEVKLIITYKYQPKNQ